MSPFSIICIRTFTFDFKYLPFGGTRQLPNQPTSGLTDYGYTGQRNLDADLGLMDYKFRFYSPTLGRFILPDNVVPNPANPQHYNRYSYVNNRPINFNDPTGHFADVLLDIGFIAYDIYDISQNGLNWTNGLSLAADVAGAFIPFATGGGAVVRAISKADDVVDVVKATPKLLDDAAKMLSEASQNSDSAFAVIGKWSSNVQQSYQTMANNIKAAHLYSDNFLKFVGDYGKEAWWKYVNEPYIRKIAEEGKTVLLSTPQRIIKKLPWEESFLRREYDLLVDTLKYTPDGNVLRPPKTNMR
ncbi:MAG: hypothetical protein KF758_15085 [Anaerolineales bacterium]|nr:hypothetical protein [Anaerolineales bacterium]